MGNDVQRNNGSVVEMDVIETSRDVYATALEEMLGIGQDKLPTALSISTLLNLLFGLKPRIIGSGLMSDHQYFRRYI